MLEDVNVVANLIKVFRLNFLKLFKEFSLDNLIFIIAIKFSKNNEC